MALAGGFWVGSVWSSGSADALAPTSPRGLAIRVADAVLRDSPAPLPFDWGEGVLLTGMMRAYTLTHDQRYLEFVRRFAEHWEKQGIGPLLKAKGYCGHWGPGFPLLLLAEATGEERYLALPREIVEFIQHKAERTQEGGLSHFFGQPQLWVDTLDMAGPLLSHGARKLNQPDWQAEAVRQLEIFVRRLQQPESGLFFHLWDEKAGQRNAALWARGNGWVTMTLTEVLKNEAPGSAAANWLRRTLEQQVAGLVPLQDSATGLWHTVLDAPETYLETSATAMFLYGLAEGRRLKLITGRFEEVERRAWAGLAARVDRAGRVLGVSAGTTPGGQSRYAAVPVGAFTWGTGAFLLAACAYAESQPSEPDGPVVAGPARPGFPPFLYAAEGARKVLRYGPDGTVVWEYPAEMARDAWALENGNVLFCHNRNYDGARHDNPSGVMEVTPDLRVVFQYATTGQVWSCQRLADGSTLVAAASQGKLLIVGPDGRLRQEIRLRNAPGHSCLRNARQLRDGHFLVAEESAHAAREYIVTGKIVREIKVAFAPFSAVRLENGHTVICGQQTMVELDREDHEVWKVEGKDYPAAGVRWFAGLQVMPNGDLFVCNAGGKVPFLEIARDKRLVWQAPAGSLPYPMGHGVQRLEVAGWADR